MRRAGFATTGSYSRRCTARAVEADRTGRRDEFAAFVRTLNRGHNLSDSRPATESSRRSI